MKYEFKPSFDRSIRTLSAEQKADIKALCLGFLDILDLRAQLSGGVGLKHLQNDFWEIRRGLKNRILFRWRQDTIEFIIAGDHDSIKNFLKKN